jgi:hypothetical protein
MSRSDLEEKGVLISALKEVARAEGLLESGAPGWVQDAPGWIDEHGWGLYRAGRVGLDD